MEREKEQHAAPGTSPVLLEKKHLLEQRTSPSPTRGMVNVWSEFGIHDEIVALYECVYETAAGPKRRLSSSGAAFEGRFFLGAQHLCFLSHSVGRVVRLCVALADITAVQSSGPASIAILTEPGQTYVFQLGKVRGEALRELQRTWTYCRLEQRFGRRIRDSIHSVEEQVDTVLQRLRDERLRLGELRKWEKLLQGTMKLPFPQSLIERFACMYEESKGQVAVGVLLVTRGYVCFSGTVPLAASPLRSVIPLKEVTSIDKRSGGLVVIFTHTRKYTFSSFNDRKGVVALLMGLWRSSLPKPELREEETGPRPQQLQQHMGAEGRGGGVRPPLAQSATQKEREFMNSLGVTEGDVPPDVRLDRYGFTVPDSLWPAYQASLVKYEKSLQKQRNAWSIFIANNDIDKLIQLHAAVVLKVVRKGIPFQRRGELWFTFSGAQLKKKGSSAGYEELHARPSVYSRDIAKDIRRTFPHHPFYRREDNVRMLERVLVAYSNRNPAIGYCQSMNFIAAMLLLFMPEDRAFWVLATIVEDRLQEYFSESMIGTLVDQKVLVELLQEKMPRLAAHCRRHDLPMAVATTKWFMCLFVGTLPTETTLRVWDCFFFQGSPIIISVALAILKVHEEELLKVASCDKFMDLSTALGKNNFDADKLLKVALDGIGVMDMKNLNHVRMRFWTDTESKLQEENKKRDMYVLQRSTAFSEEQLERWHRAFLRGELRSSGAFTDCTPRAGPAGGVEEEAFVELFATVAPAFASPAAAPLMKALFALLDRNHDLCIKFKDFVCAADTVCNGTVEAKLELFFSAAAPDGSLDSTGCHELVQQLYAIFCPAETAAAHAMTTADAGGAETVDLKAFVDLVTQQPVLACSLAHSVDEKELENAPVERLRTSTEAKPQRDLACSPVARTPPATAAP